MNNIIGKTRAWKDRHHRALVRLLSILLAIPILFYGFCVFLSYRAADIFNAAINDRDLFPGSITVESITATPTGKVSFEQLIWRTRGGALLAQIPSGSFHVKVRDIIEGHIGTQTITEISLKHPYLHLYFDENMEMMYLKKPEDARVKKGSKKNKPLQVTGPDSNRPFDCMLILKHARIEAEAPGRYFAMENARLRLHLHTKGESTISLDAGPFTGTADAGLIHLDGSIDFAKENPTCDMYLSIKDCNPQSLDVGMNINEKTSVEAEISGDVAHPVIDGTLTMPKLEMPGLYFTNLVGEFHYQDGKLIAPKVTARAFEGDILASGTFNLDEKSYEADFVGTNLQGGIAAKDLLFNCNVMLNLHMSENKKQHTKRIYGDFYSTPGHYHIFAFRKISGEFEHVNKVTTFHNVVFEFRYGKVKAKHFSLEKGNLHVDSVYFENDEMNLFEEL